MPFFFPFCVALCGTAPGAAAMDADPGRHDPLIARLHDLDLESLDAERSRLTGSERSRADLVRWLVGLREGDPDVIDASPGPVVPIDVGAEWAIVADLVGVHQATHRGDFDGARRACDAAFARLADVELALLRSQILRCRLIEHATRGEIDKALTLALAATESARVSGSRIEYWMSTANEALVLFMAELHGPSLGRYEELQRHASELPPDIATVVNFNLGLVYLEVGQAEQALARFQAGVDWAESSGLAFREPVANVYKARALNALGRPDEAITTLAPWVEGLRSAFNDDNMAHALLTVAEAELALGLPERALEHARRGLDVSAREGNALRWGDLALVRATALQVLGQFDAAADAVAATVERARATGHRVLPRALAFQAEVAAARGDDALAYRSLAESLASGRDDVGEQLIRRVSALDSLHAIEQARRDASIAELRAAQVRADAAWRQLLTNGVAAALVLMAAGAWLLLELRRQRRVLDREAERLRSLRTLTSGVAHDFNNLLAIVTSATTLLEEQPSAAERAPLFAAIHRATATGARIVESMLAYAAQQPLAPELCAVEEALGSARDQLQDAVGELTEFAVVLGPGRVRVDRGALQTAVCHLLRNAAEAAGPDGHVRLVGASDAGRGRYRIKVEDDGPGMSREQLERAFEPFYTTRNDAVAAGLGLSHVDGFARQSGGRVQIDTAPGAGCRVLLDLPLVQSEQWSE